MTDAGPSDADRLLDIELPHSFRGLDPDAVQALLTEATQSLRAAQERQDELLATVAELESALAAARADATTELETAKRRGREIVGEAQLVRRRILEDLIRRRTALRRQIDQLRAGRERLLEAYEVVGQTVEEATAELGLALPASQAAAQRAGRRADGGDGVTEEELHAMEAEIDAARAAGLPILDPPTPAELAAATRPEEAPADDQLSPLVEVEPVVAAFEEMRVLGPVEAEAVVVDEVAVTGETDDTGAEVVPLFDRLRAEEDDRQSADAERAAVVPEPDLAVEEDVEEDVEEAEAAVDPIEATPTEEDDEDSVAVLADDLARRLRRALADEQNQVLDRLRQDRRGQLGLDDLLGEPGPRVARLASSVEGRLQEAVAGSNAEVDVADAANHLAAAVVDGVQADLSGRLAAEGDDLVRPVREAFRAWRTDRLLPLATATAVATLDTAP